MSEHVYEDSSMEHEDYHIIPFGWKHEEIVRCKDCKHYENHGSFVMCILPDDDGDYACWIVEPDGFCKWGERSE